MAQTNVQVLSGDVVISSNLEVGTANLFVDTTTSNVGIHTNTPGYTLDVAGDINLSGNLYQGGEAFKSSLWSTGVSSNIHYTAGNVGIGLTNPVANLDIAGTMRVGDGLSNVVDLTTTQRIDGYSHLAQLVHPTLNVNNQQFGWDTAISADGIYTVVGVRVQSHNGNYAGGAYVFVRNTSNDAWSLQSELTHSGKTAGDYFGSIVSISADGTYALIGAQYTGSSVGTAYVFVRNNTSWSLQATLTHPSPASGDQFGSSSAISGDGLYAICAAQQDDTGASNAGTVQVYIRNGTSWSHQAQLVAPTPAADDTIGGGVAISTDGTYVVVGCQNDDITYNGSALTDAGCVQVYIRNGTSWSHQAQVLHLTPTANDYFGKTVAISGDGTNLIVGATGDDTGASYAGSAQVYIRNGTTWSHQAQLLHPSPGGSDQMGTSVAISTDGKVAAVGVFGDNVTVSGGSVADGGSIQVFSRDGTTWSHNTELKHPSPTQSDYFGGQGVSISNTGAYLITGVTGDDPSGTNTGSVQIFKGGSSNELTVSSSIKADGTFISFTGQHICFPEGRMWEGLVVSANQNKYMSLNGPVTMGLGAIKSSESLPVVSLSNVANDRSVFGVVDRFEWGGTERTQTIGIGQVSSTKEVGDNRVIVNSIGEGALWVTNTNGNIVSGDYLTTSSLPGYAQKQDSDNSKNYTVAKITMACDFSPEDIPVQIIKKKDNGDNDLDPHGRFQWVDTEKTQKAYKVMYLTSDGKGTDQSNAVHIAAYVGCTYHCG